MLCLQGDRVDPESVERALLWFQTSSPSALLLASAQAALHQLQSRAGQRRHQAALAVAERLRQRCHQLPLPLVANQDPLRLVVHTAAMGISGLEADSWLIERGVVAELPEPGTLTFCLGEVPPVGVVWRLPRQLLALRQALGSSPLSPFSAPPLPLAAAPEMDLGQAWRARSVTVSLAEAAGCIAAEPLCPYPPGIPLLIPGERIDPARAQWLAAQQALWPGQIADTVKVVAT